MSEILEPNFRRCSSNLSKGEIKSISIEGGDVILYIKGETGIFCDYHVSNSKALDLTIGDEIQFYYLPLDIDEIEKLGKDFCISIEVVKPTKAKILFFNNRPTPSGQPKDPSCG